MALLGYSQPDSLQALLGDYYSRKQAGLSLLGGALQAAGAGLASGRPGAWAQGLALGGTEGLDNYRRQALAEYGIKQRQDEQDYQRGRDANADKRWQMQYDYNVNRDKKADELAAKTEAWNAYLREQKINEDQRLEDQRNALQNEVTGFMDKQTQQGASLPFSPGVRSIARQGGLAGPSATDQWRFDNAQPYVGAQDFGNAFQQITAQPPAPKDPISVGKGSRLYDTNTKTFIETPGGTSADPAIDDPLKISKDYQNQPGFQRLKEVAPTVNSMVKSLDDPSAMADLDFVYGLAKILDPTSVVRESEAGMVIDSQGIAPSLLGQLNKIMTGEQAMLPETRRKLVAVALRRANEFKAQAEQERGFYGNMAKESGYNPDTYLQAVPAIPGIPTDEEGWQTLPNGTRIRQKGN